jgi:hypothetical protein
VQRRAFLAGVAACGGTGLAVPGSAWGLDSAWWPYPADTAVRIEPVLTQPDDGASDRKRMLQSRVHDAGAATASTPRPPRAYEMTGKRFAVDPWVLYGVALQESQLKFGVRALPYPWTLCVAGVASRYGSYDGTLQALRAAVEKRGIRNVDCGAMQVNWRWHQDKLGSFERALDPYPNLAVGAQILREHFERQGEVPVPQAWRRAVALYHTGSDADAATVARGRRYSDDVFARLARLRGRYAA